MAKLIDITLDPETGEFSVDLTGFHGKGCEAVIDAFKSLGTQTKVTKKPEYRQVQTNLQKK